MVESRSANLVVKVMTGTSNAPRLLRPVELTSTCLPPLECCHCTLAYLIVYIVARVAVNNIVSVPYHHPYDTLISCEFDRPHYLLQSSSRAGNAISIWSYLSCDTLQSCSGYGAFYQLHRRPRALAMVPAQCTCRIRS